MNKNELEFRKAALGAQRLATWLGLVKHAITLGFAVWALDIILKGLTPFIGQNPESIAAFAKLVEAINPSNITGYIIATIAALGWRLERTGRKRAIRLKDGYQRKVEGGDAYRSSSGLTEDGDTPEE